MARKNVVLQQLVYDCDQCGACCRHLIIEAEHLDVLREPRIASEATLLDGHGKIPLESASWGMNGRKSGVFDCVFLAENRCGIYATRPSVCVNHQAGSDQCQQARMSQKLPPLMGRTSDGSMIDRIRIIAGEPEE